MKLYEYLRQVFLNNEIDVEEIAQISVVYLKCPNKFDHTTWELIRKEIKGTNDVPINPMHIEEWDDDIDNVFRIIDNDIIVLIMDIGIKLYNGHIFHSAHCMYPINSLIDAMMIPME